MARTDVTFRSGAADCAAWLYQPDGAGPHPIVVMGHGFSATRELRLDAYAERFQDAGLGVVVFDYRYFGASGGSPRQVVSIHAQLADWRAAVAYARTVSWVDPDRVGLFGTSFGGGHAIRTAADDPRVAAVVAQCPMQNGRATARELGLRTIARLMAHGLLDLAKAAIGRSPHYVPAAAPPGGLAVMTTEDSLPGMTALVPEGSSWRNEVAARILLSAPFARPGARAKQLGMPALWCICDKDTLCPPDDGIRWASQAPHGETRHYPLGHFEIYVGDGFEQAVADQTDFYRRHLLQTPTA
jgi:dienelactone hydrolase